MIFFSISILSLSPFLIFSPSTFVENSVLESTKQNRKGKSKREQSPETWRRNRFSSTAHGPQDLRHHRDLRKKPIQFNRIAILNQKVLVNRKKKSIGPQFHANKQNINQHLLHRPQHTLCNHRTKLNRKVKQNQRKILRRNQSILIQRLLLNLMWWIKPTEKVRNKKPIVTNHQHQHNQRCLWFHHVLKLKWKQLCLNHHRKFLHLHFGTTTTDNNNPHPNQLQVDQYFLL